MSQANLADYLIRTMRDKDLAFAAECTAAEGWQSEDLTTLEGFLIYDPQGCFIAERGGKPVGICVATRYGKSGFIGELIVQPEARGKGIGAALLKHAVSYLQSTEVETVYLDGVVKAVDLYQRGGFRKICRSWRYSGELQGSLGAHVRRMNNTDLDHVLVLDRSAFRADRSFFLRRRLQIYPELSYVLVESGKVNGYLMGRGNKDWISAGPWVVHDEAINPVELLQAFAMQAKDRPISIGILDTNHWACELVRSLGFSERPDSPWRMALGHQDDLGASPACYAIGSAAKG